MMSRIRSSKRRLQEGEAVGFTEVSRSREFDGYMASHDTEMMSLDSFDSRQPVLVPPQNKSVTRAYRAPLGHDVGYPQNAIAQRFDTSVTQQSAATGKGATVRNEQRGK